MFAKVKEISFFDLTKKFSLWSLGMKYLHGHFWLGKVPFLRDIHPWLTQRKTSLSWLPVNEGIEKEPDIPLPPQVVVEYIQKANHIAIFSICGCRKSEKCSRYPHDIGCLLMGDSVLEIKSGNCREATKEEALAHLDKAVKAGLVPVIGKARVDNFIFQVPDRGKLLTVCLCCECCCVSRFVRHLPAEHLNRMFMPLDGLSIEVTNDCIGCGECVEHCFVGAIQIRGGKAVMSDMCRICGRCATYCPEEAIRIRMNNPRYVENFQKRLEPHVDVT